MRVSQRIEEGVKTLEWVKANTQGGVLSWSGSPNPKPYPEVSGYLIPTLLRYGETDLARQYADWLLEIQYANGAFDGLDGIPRAFDTGACYEGLEAAFAYFKQLDYKTAAAKAREWLLVMRRNETFQIHEGTIATHFYNYRVNGLLGIQVSPPEQLTDERSHYILYALEGLWNLGQKDYVIEHLEKIYLTARVDGLVPFWIYPDWTGRGEDACATAQLAVLMMKSGLGTTGLLMYGLQGMVQESGAVRMNLESDLEPAWAAKYYLDAIWELENA